MSQAPTTSHELLPWEEIGDPPTAAGGPHDGRYFYAIARALPDLPAAALPEGTTPADVAGFLGADLRTQLVPVGQDGGFASVLATRFATVVARNVSDGIFTSETLVREWRLAQSRRLAAFDFVLNL